jgi:hypothetical protein
LALAKRRFVRLYKTPSLINKNGKSFSLFQKKNHNTKKSPKETQKQRLGDDNTK